MARIRRKKVHREWLENQLAKYERRIQKLAENAYHIRQAIELLDSQEAARNQEKGDITNALHTSGVEAAVGIESTDQNTGQSNVPDSAVTEEILGQ